ncbi:MAG: Fic family protein [Planctomycetota bacterium]|nr:Fic family protein [Planctomycetota bacterium]
MPDDLPPALEWASLTAELRPLYDGALLALGRLNGLHLRIEGAQSLLRALWVREAKLSSKVENIDTTASDMVFAAAQRDLPERSRGKEAWNYVLALEFGVESPLPLCTRLIKEIHAKLLTGVRGGDTRPGEFRDVPVYIGDPLRGPREARYVPPPPGEKLDRCIQAFESFVHRNDQRIPPLIAIAIAHYQFEAIHPFRDGNGRVGRVLASRSLVKEQLLDRPTVYFSEFIHKHRQRYADLLLGVSVHGNWKAWVEFMLQAIMTQAQDSIVRTEHLLHLRQSYYGALHQARANPRLMRLVDRLFTTPVVNAQEAQLILDVEKPTVYADLRLCERLRILTEYTGKKRFRDWVARDILHAIEASTEDLRSVFDEDP